MTRVVFAYSSNLIGTTSAHYNTENGSMITGRDQDSGIIMCTRLVHIFTNRWFDVNFDQSGTKNPDHCLCCGVACATNTMRYVHRPAWLDFS